MSKQFGVLKASDHGERLKTKGHIDLLLDKEKRNTVIENQEILSYNKDKYVNILLDVTRALGRQGISFRGTEGDENRNFRQIVIHLIARYNPVLKHWNDTTQFRPYHVIYLSGRSQNEFIKPIANKIHSSHEEILSVVERIVGNDARAKERLVDVLEAKDKAGAGIAQDILRSLNNLQIIDIDRLLVDELNYQLLVRGIPCQDSVAEKRKLLRATLRLEVSGNLTIPDFELNAEEELPTCGDKLILSQAEVRICFTKLVACRRRYAKQPPPPLRKLSMRNAGLWHRTPIYAALYPANQSGRKGKPYPENHDRAVLRSELSPLGFSPFRLDHGTEQLDPGVDRVPKTSIFDNMQAAGDEERALAISNGDIDEDGVPYISITLDGGWSKRSYGHSYTANSGMLYKIKNDVKGVAVEARKLLTKDIIEKLGTAVQKAIYANAHGDVTNLREDIRSPVKHVFGNHEACKEYICDQHGDMPKNIFEKVGSSKAHHHIFIKNT
ncbi:hypothetical protein ILUMI_19354 [Ignelater luminosus]|uniref:Mutator-like transposase domain-containing protein n=1 Tax=Ignelater luminosus TaxID=2038154 RepID=A0A8K0CIC0_IGNLU|nr:hypothetical protein ILUMI_19354 [Ignelater luminosus]